MKSFTIFEEYLDLITLLSEEEDQKDLLWQIAEYMFYDKEPNLNDSQNKIFKNLKRPLEISKTNSNNAKRNKNEKETNKKRNKNEKETNKKRNKNEKETNKKRETSFDTKSMSMSMSIVYSLMSNNKYKFINNNDNLVNKIDEWIKYKQERKENYKEIGLKSLLTEIDNNCEIYGIDSVIDLINSSMASNYKGIVWDKLKNKNEIKPKVEDRPWI